MRNSRKLLRIFTGFAIVLGWQSVAVASFLDSDFWCRTYGCTVVHDGNNLDIYDNYIFAQGRCCIPIGAPMIPYTTTFGSFNLTGSLANPVGPTGSQSMMLGITQNGTTVSQSVIDDGDGYLDAGDQLCVFNLNANTAITLDGQGREYSHSFFITSRNTRFSLRARSSINNASGDFVTTLGLEDIKIAASVSQTGNDSGFRYGRRASTSNISIVNGIVDLGDLQAAPTRLIEFDRFSGIRRRNGNINDQTIRLDFLYTMPDYDFSMGVGTLNVDMVFDMYREP